MPAQLVSLIEAESLVNDGTEVVLFSIALATGTGEPASAPGVFVDHLRPKCWCQQRGALSQTGSGRRSSIRDPYLGKVGFSFCIQKGSKVASERVLTPNFNGGPRLPHGDPL
jgi:hypothetical protein